MIWIRCANSDAGKDSTGGAISLDGGLLVRNIVAVEASLLHRSQDEIDWSLRVIMNESEGE